MPFRGRKLCSAVSLSLTQASLIPILPPSGPHAALLIPPGPPCLLILETSAARRESEQRAREQDGAGLGLE